MRLRYKFFAAFLIMSCLIVGLLVGIMQVFVNKNFAEFVNRQELESLSSLVTDLAGKYKEHNGWEHLRDDPWQWREILDETFPGKGKPEIRSASGRGRQWEEGHEPPPRNHRRPGFGPPGRRPPRHNPPPGHSPPPGHIPPDEIDPLHIKARVNLFDTEKNHILGPYRPEDRVLYREINVDDEIVGWLGLTVPRRMKNPLGLDYLAAQKKAIYMFGIGILLLAAVISYLLSKHLISPIQELIKGTRAMASFKFDTEINVRSRDELGMLADNFNHMAQTIKRYEEMRKQWVSDISHELRTPISILKGKIEALQDGVRKMTPDTLDSLHNDVTRLGKLVEDLHFLSLSDSEVLQVKKSPVKPLDLLRETLESFQIRLEKQSITVQADLPEHSDLTIHGNKDSLSRLFVNLIENTLRYTDSPGTLKVSHTMNHTWFTLCYEDSSPGVPDDGLTLIFNRLYRVDKSRSRASGGSGLGLSICKQIVGNHKGTIHSDHSSLGGLKFTIRLPVG